MEDVGIFYGHLFDYPAFWYILPLLGIFFQFFVSCAKKNLATLLRTSGF
jgi:hypothetical protein